MDKFTHNGREMTIFRVDEAAKNTATDLIARGWEPRFFMATGKRGSTVMALRVAATGEYRVVS